MSKNAYEIRLEILKEAVGNCWNRYHQSVEGARLNAWTKHDGENLDKIGNYICSVEVPSAEQIVEEANKLYKFVCET